MNKAPRVRILPASPMLGAGLVVLACWYAGASQSNGAATMLGALLFGAGAVSAVEAIKNLRGIRADVLQCADVHAGSRGAVDVRLEMPEQRGSGASLSLDLPGAVWQEPRAGSAAVIRLTWAPDQRGLVAIARVKIRSRYPLGWFAAETRLQTHGVCHVYPRLAGIRELPGGDGSGTQPIVAASGEEDLAGHTVHREGESLRHIDWKASARREQIMLKRFSGSESRRIELRWDQPRQIGIEEKLSQLAVWIVEAELRGLTYALSIPKRRISHGRGAAHRQECLRALAAFGHET